MVHMRASGTMVLLVYPVAGVRSATVPGVWLQCLGALWLWLAPGSLRMFVNTAVHGVIVVRTC